MSKREIRCKIVNSPFPEFDKMHKQYDLVIVSEWNNLIFIEARHKHTQEVMQEIEVDKIFVKELK